MEEFEQFKAIKAKKARAAALESIKTAKNIKELLTVWKSFTKERQLEKEIVERKDARKGELSESSKYSTK